MSEIKILIAGEGGQGVQVVAKIITKIFFNLNYDVTYLPNFGVEQRGGVSLAFIQISKEKISFPKFQKADLVVIITERAKERVLRYFKKDTTIIFDNSLIEENILSDLKYTKIAIPATYFAKEKLIQKVFNIIILGAILGELNIKKNKEVKAVLEEVFREKYKKEPQLKHFNEKGFEIGLEIINSIKKEDKWRKKILSK